MRLSKKSAILLVVSAAVTAVIIGLIAWAIVLMARSKKNKKNKKNKKQQKSSRATARAYAAKRRSRYRKVGFAQAVLKSNAHMVDQSPFVCLLADGKTVVTCPEDPDPPASRNYLWGDAFQLAQQRAEAAFGRDTKTFLKPGLFYRVLKSSAALWSNPTTCSGSNSGCPSGVKCSHWDGDDGDSGYVCCPSGADEICDAANFCTAQPDGNACSCDGECLNGCNSLGFCGSNTSPTSTVKINNAVPTLFISNDALSEYLLKKGTYANVTNFMFTIGNDAITGFAQKLQFGNVYQASDPDISNWDLMKGIGSYVSAGVKAQLDKISGAPIDSSAMEGQELEEVEEEDEESEQSNMWYISPANIIGAIALTIGMIAEAIWNDGKEYLSAVEINPCMEDGWIAPWSLQSPHFCTENESGTWNLLDPYMYLPYVAKLNDFWTNVEGTLFGYAWVTQGHTYDLIKVTPYYMNNGIVKNFVMVDVTPLFEFSGNAGSQAFITNNSSLPIYVAIANSNYLGEYVLEKGMHVKFLEPLSMQKIATEAETTGNWYPLVTVMPGETSSALQQYNYDPSSPILFFVNPIENGGQTRFSAVCDGLDNVNSPVVTWVPDGVQNTGSLNVMPVTFYGTYATGFVACDYVANLGASPDYNTPPRVVTQDEFLGNSLTSSNTSLTYDCFNFSSRVGGQICAFARDVSQPQITIVNYTPIKYPLQMNGNYLLDQQAIEEYSVTTFAQSPRDIGFVGNGTVSLYNYSAKVPASLDAFDTVIFNLDGSVLFVIQHLVTYGLVGPSDTLDPLTMQSGFSAAPLASLWMEGTIVGLVSPDGLIPGGDNFYNVTTLPDPTSFTSITVPGNGSGLVFANTPPTNTMPPASNLQGVYLFPCPPPFKLPVIPDTAKDGSAYTYMLTISGQLSSLGDILLVPNAAYGSYGFLFGPFNPFTPPIWNQNGGGPASSQITIKFGVERWVQGAVIYPQGEGMVDVTGSVLPDPSSFTNIFYHFDNTFTFS